MRAWTFLTSPPLRRSARSSSTVSNSEASSAHSSVTSGSTFSFTSLTRTWKSTGLLVGVRVGGGELEDVADLGAAQLVVELGDDRAAADLVEVVVGGEAGLRLAVAGCRRCRW